MEILNIKENKKYLKEYVELCFDTWGNNSIKKEKYIENKLEKMDSTDKVISILGLINNDILIGFVSLLKYDGYDRKDLSPWYATMFVKKEYRGNKYSKLLNDAILKEASRLGYSRIYLKTDLVNYYEKFGAKYLEELNNGESLYYIELYSKKSEKIQK